MGFWGFAGQVATVIGAIALAWWIWRERRRGGPYDRPGIIEPSKPWPRGRQDAPGTTISPKADQDMRRCDSCGQTARKLHHYLDASVCDWCHQARQRAKLEGSFRGMGEQIEVLKRRLQPPPR